MTEILITNITVYVKVTLTAQTAESYLELLTPSLKDPITIKISLLLGRKYTVARIDHDVFCICIWGKKRGSQTNIVVVFSQRIT